MAPDRTKQAGAVPGDSISRQEQSALRRFTLAEGALMLSLGTLALIFPLVASVVDPTPSGASWWRPCLC